MQESLVKLLIASEGFSKEQYRRISEIIPGEVSQGMHIKFPKQILSEVSEDVLEGISEGNPGRIS